LRSSEISCWSMWSMLGGGDGNKSAALASARRGPEL
jgi:hypothetical protein